MSSSTARALDSRPVNVTFDLKSNACAEDDACPGERISGDGLVVRSGDEGSTFFAEIRTASNERVVLDVVYGAGTTWMHYTEVSAGETTFIGQISDGAFYAPAANATWTTNGNFAFRAIDDTELRIIENGTITLKQPDPPPRPGHEGGGNVHGGVVVVVDDPGCGGGTAPDDSESGGCGGDTSTDDPESASDGGCEGDSADTSSDSGCSGDSADTSSDSGCSDSGSSMSSGGCDDSSSSMSSSGCSGDGAYAVHKNTKATSSMFRFAWPVVIVGVINRRIRARAAKKTPPPPSR